MNTPIPVPSRRAAATTLTALSLMSALFFVPAQARAELARKPAAMTLATQAPVQLFEHSEPIGLDLAKVMYTTPADKMLVIETASIELSVPAGTSAFAYVQTTVGGVTARHFVPMTFQTTFNAGASDIRIGNISTRIYADPGTTVYFEVHRNGGAAGEVSMTLSGYELDTKL